MDAGQKREAGKSLQICSTRSSHRATERTAWVGSPDWGEAELCRPLRCGFWEKEQVRQGKLEVGFGIQLPKMWHPGLENSSRWRSLRRWQKQEDHSDPLLPHPPTHLLFFPKQVMWEVPSLYQEDGRHSPEISTNQHVNLIYLVIISSFTTPGLPRWLMVKNLPAVQETGAQFWVGKIQWRREWQPTPVFLPGESRGKRNLAGYSPWGGVAKSQTRLSDQHLLPLA